MKSAWKPGAWILALLAGASGACGARSSLPELAIASTGAGGTGGAAGACLADTSPCAQAASCCAGVCSQGFCGVPPCMPGEGSVVLAAGLTWPIAIALDATFVYASELDEHGAIVRVPKAGGPTEEVTSTAWPDGLAVDADYVYVAADQGVARVPKSGGIVEVLGPSNSPTSVVLDGGDLYFADYLGNAIGRIPKGGGAVALLAPSEPSSPYRVMVGPDRVYWSGILPGIRSVPKAGGAVTEIVGGRPRSHVVDLGQIYYTDNEDTTLKRTGLGGEGTMILADLTPWGTFAEGVALDATHAYVTVGSGLVARVPRDGGAVEVLDEAEGTTPLAIAVDPWCVYWSIIGAGGPGQGALMRRAK